MAMLGWVTWRFVYSLPIAGRKRLTKSNLFRVIEIGKDKVTKCVRRVGQEILAAGLSLVVQDPGERELSPGRPHAASDALTV